MNTLVAFPGSLCLAIVGRLKDDGAQRPRRTMVNVMFMPKTLHTHAFGNLLTFYTLLGQVDIQRMGFWLMVKSHGLNPQSGKGHES